MFEHIDPKKDKIIYPFKKSDGFCRPCKRGCPNYVNCSDVFWDYTNGIYLTLCAIHPEFADEGICWCEDYENDGTEPLTIEEWNKLKESEDKL